MAITRPSLRRTLLIGAAGAVVLAALVVGARLYLASPASWPSEEFSPSAWASSPRHERFRFYKDLASRRLLDQQSKQTVVRLLGAPDYESPGSEYVQYVLAEARPDNRMLYALYMAQIEFDSAGQVRRYMVRHE